MIDVFVISYNLTVYTVYSYTLHKVFFRLKMHCVYDTSTIGMNRVRVKLELNRIRIKLDKIR